MSEAAESAEVVALQKIVKAAEANVKRSPGDARAHAQLGMAYQQLDLRKHEGGTMQVGGSARARERSSVA